jgi:hypothetical protein
VEVLPLIGIPQRCKRVYTLADDDDAVHVCRLTTITAIAAATHIAVLLLLGSLLLR